MTLAELQEEISIELELMGAIVQEAISLLDDLEGREPTVRERTAAGAFLAQFYGRIENIADQSETAPGIAVGGLQHEGLLPF